MGLGWAVVLGASSGFGEAAARAFAQSGYPVLGVHLDRRSTARRAGELLDDLRGHQPRSLLHNGNAVRDRVRAAALDRLQEAMAPGERVVALVHSLAFGSLEPVFAPGGGGLSPEQVHMTLDVMAHSLLWWARELVERELMGEGGRILALTSAGSERAWSGYGAISAAKAALEAHVRQCAVELAPRGITANAVLAGICPTPSLERIPGHEALLERARERNPRGRLTTPDDVARCLVALCHPDTGWMTGSLLRVDGGESVAG